MIDENDTRIKAILGDNKPSKAQLDIIDFIVHKIGNATVQSRAGSGKSKTIELAAAFVPSNKKVLIVSYNRHIAKHLKSKLSNMSNIDVRTYHSLGYKILTTKYRDKLKDVKLDEDKYKNYITENIDELSDNQWFWLTTVQRWCYKKNLENLVEYARYNKAQSAKEIEKIANKYKVALISNECEVVKKILKWGSENINVVDYTDLIWLPYELNITANMPSLQYDMIFVDEAQDSSLIQQALLDICKKRNTRWLAFGDAKQTINSWCGSDEQAFNNFDKHSNTRSFSLNVSYRCSKAVAEQVKKYIPDFEVPETAPIGSVNYLASLSDIQNGDLILCRMTAPLVKLHLQLLKEHKPSKVNGIELGMGLIKVINNTGQTKMSDVLDVLYRALIKTWVDLKENYSCSLKDVASEHNVVALYDQIKSIEAISEGLTEKDDVIKRIQDIFVDCDCDKDGDRITDVLDDVHIHLSTIHRAKGLESNNVFILCPSLMPLKFAREDWEKEAEDNLIYVAWSRAKINLGFIDEKEIGPSRSYNELDDLYKELLEIKKKYETS